MLSSTCGGALRRRGRLPPTALGAGAGSARSSRESLGRRRHGARSKEEREKGEPVLKSPSMAAVLSMIMSGLGQIYNGQPAKGSLVGLLLIACLVSAAEVHPVWYLPASTSATWAVYDAHETAKKINAARWGDSWKSLLT